MQTEIYKLDAAKPDAAGIKKAAELIDAGRFVAFPTETVYGIACRVRTDSLSRLDELKGRSAGRYYTLHIADKTSVNKYVPTIGLRAQKLVKSAWPGPVTIVFELGNQDLARQREGLEREVFENLYRDNSVGIRCPDHRVAAALLRQTDSAVVAPSANISERPPPTDAEQVLAQLAGRIDLLLDAGPCRYKISSTVVKTGKKGLEILREGVYSRQDIEGLAQVRFLFVCTGNTCRSPMAAGLFKKQLAEKLGCKVDRLVEKGYKVVSAGTMGMTGIAATAEAVAACSAKGVDISSHSSTALSKKLIEDSDLVFGMCRMHCEVIAALSTDGAGKSMLLAEGVDIPDPIGRSQGVYNGCADLIEKAVGNRICELVI